MSQVHLYRLPNGRAPYEEYLNVVAESGAKQEAAKIRAYISKLAELGSAGMARQEWAKKLNDVWELRLGPHRVFYFWDEENQRYVLLNGFRKRTPKTPRSEIERAERLRQSYLDHIKKEGEYD